MITVLIAENEEKIKELLAKMLGEAGNTSIDIKKHENIIKIIRDENLNKLVTLKDKVIELEESLYNEKQGELYKSVIEVIEKPLIEHGTRCGAKPS